MSNGRFERQIRIFGVDGQTRLSTMRVALVGTGGTGSHVAQQLAYLGVGSLDLIDRDYVEESNLNRLIGAFPSDVEQGRQKVDVVSDHIERIAPTASVRRIRESVVTDAGYEALRNSDIVISCVDRDSVRLIVNEVCVAYSKPLFDLATDIPDDVRAFGGRVFFAANKPSDAPGCLACADLFNLQAIQHDFMSDAQRAEDAKIYGVARADLVASGPSVVSLNGILASIAVTEFLAHVTGLRQPNRLLFYKGAFGLVTTETGMPRDCPTCGAGGMRGRGEAADTERWIREGWGGRL